jgi:glycosyltransferase involved in cell wall biosynthesis
MAILARAVYPLHGHGGLERHVADLVRHLIARDVAVTLVTPPDTRGAITREHATTEASPFDDPRCTRLIVPYTTFPGAGRRGTTVLDRSTAYPWFGARAGRAVARLVRAGHIDLVYGHGASALGYARARRRGAAAPLIFNPHGLEEFGATEAPQAFTSWLKRAAYAPLRAAVRACARDADCVIATDRVLQPMVERHLGVAADRVRVVPNAVDLDRADRLAGSEAGRQMRAAAGIATTDVLLLSVGRLEANKGFHLLARALAMLPDGPWRWVLVGDGPYRAAVERAIDAAGVRHRTVLAGRVSDRELHAWYEASDLFVHPTLYEGSSLVTLEAMAHRRAVVATTAGGLPDKVVPGTTGWLVPPGDVAALGTALGEALAQPGRLPAMGRAGRALAQEAFSWPHAVQLLLGVCAELLGEASGRFRLH